MRRQRVAASRFEAALLYVILGALTTALALWCGFRVVQANGELSFPLDDSYIHLQYARSFARLEPFEFSPGAEPSPGTTSLLWPLLLSGAAALSEPALIWLASALGFFSLVLLAVEAKRIGDVLFDPVAARLAPLLVLSCGAFSWFAASGMEVVLFAWLLLRCLRSSIALASPEPGVGPIASRSAPHLRELTLLGALLPWVRPEGAIYCWGIATLMAGVRVRRWRVHAGLLLVAPLLPPLVFWLFTGSWSSTTARAKWLPLSPYADGTLIDSVLYNTRLFLGTLLNGEGWSPMFLPTGYAWLGWLSLPALFAVAVSKRRHVAGALCMAVGLGILIPTTYETYLVNRLRYLWPFAPIWLLGLAALCESLGRASEWLARRALIQSTHATVIRRGTTALSGATLCFGLGSQLPESVNDLTESASAIHRQQVALGRWASTLPEDSQLGVNDTGAIAFYSAQRVFDVVGLTTLGEAKYWAAGAGSRFEHYERLGPGALPTHFIVYPEWFALPPLLGERLTERYVDASILGGKLMVAHRADYTSLNSGSLPGTNAPRERIIDELDVADLESEADHDYDLDAYGLGWQGKQRNRIFVQPTPSAPRPSHWRPRVDGGRAERMRESFWMELRPNARLSLRLASSTGATLELRIEGWQVRFAVPPSNWYESEFSLPQDISEGRAHVKLTSLDPFAALHYWVIDDN